MRRRPEAGEAESASSSASRGSPRREHADARMVSVTRHKSPIRSLVAKAGGPCALVPREGKPQGWYCRRGREEAGCKGLWWSKES